MGEVSGSIKELQGSKGRGSRSSKGEDLLEEAGSWDRRGLQGARVHCYTV